MEQIPNQPLQPQETAEMQQQAVLHDMEVVARSLDMVPRNSELGKYLADPATKLVRGEGGHSHVVEAGHSNYDRFKQDTVTALHAFTQGKVAQIKLMGGMVNGHIDAHDGSSIKNLRYAFEDLRHMGITGSAGFHEMLNPRGRNIGSLEIDTPQEVSEKNAALLAEGAARIQSGEAAVMFNDYKDEPRSKMYGMTDPQTGELLKNTYLLVGSGTFSDKDGTASNFSNMAWAEVVLIPDEKIEAVSPKTAEQPVTQEIDMNAELAAPEAFDIDKVDWTPFQESTFKVRRSDGSVDNGGWSIKEVKEVNGVYKAVITSWDKQHGGVQKTIPVEELVSWQNEQA